MSSICVLRQAFVNIRVQSSVMLNLAGRRHLAIIVSAITLGLLPLKVFPAVVPTVTVGPNYTIVLASDGTLQSFGDDSYGQLGIGRILNSPVPIHIAGIDNVRDFAVGYRSVFALKADGTVWAWGGNTYGVLGDGATQDRASPVQVTSLTGIRSIAVSVFSGMALKADGTVWVWGYDGYDVDGYNPLINQAVQVSGISSVIAISNRSGHKVALKSDGTVWTWGFNESGELGLGTQRTCGTPCDLTGQGTATPQQVPGLTDIVALNSGDGQGATFALKSDGTLWGWGVNDSGQLGDGSTTTRTSPVLIPEITGVTAVSAGDSTALAIRADGSVWSWGDNFYGQLGHGTRSWSPEANTPMEVFGLSAITGVSSSGALSVAVDSVGSVWTWGWNFEGELGDGSYNESLVPKKVPALAGILYARAANGFVVALKNDGTLWAWGSNLSGQLGTSVINRNLPTSIPNMSSVSAVSIAYDPLALKSDGTVWQWGKYSRLSGSSTPTLVAGLPVISAVAAGTNFSLALTPNGAVWGWGDPRAGVLGSMATGAVSEVPGLKAISAIAAGNLHALFLKQDGTVLAMGANEAGQLGVSPDGSCSYMVFADMPYSCSNTPLQIPGLSNVVAIYAFDSTSYAVQRDGSVWAWGSNINGEAGQTQKGACSYQQQPGQQPLPCFGTPQRIPDLDNVIALSNQLALKSDGTVWSWGGRTYPVATTPLGPKAVAGLTGIIAIGSAGLGLTTYGHGIAMRADGTLLAVGNNQFGQLGDGTFAQRLSPVLVSNPSADGPLDLIPEVPNSFSSGMSPAFWAQVTKANTVSTAIKYNGDDLDNSGSVYVVAYLDPASPLLVAAAPPVGFVSPSGTTKSATTVLVAAVLTRNGWKQTVAGLATEPVYSGTLGTTSNTFAMYDSSKFDAIKDRGIFCIGYAGVSASSAKGLIRSVVTGADPAVSDCPPILVGAAVDVQAPNAPSNLMASAVGPGQVNLSWTASADNVGVAHYNVYRGASLIVQLGNVTNYTDISPQASTAYSYTVMACDAALNCSGQSASAQISTPAQANVVLAVGWNLVGNGGSSAMNVASLFGDVTKVVSIWKWIRAGSTAGVVYPAWAVYTPSVDGGAAYATSKGYDTLATIQSGEGFWVNAKATFSVPLTAPAWIRSSVFQPAQSNSLTSGWNLIATGEAHSGSAFNQALSVTPISTGTIPVNLTTMWSWDNPLGRWYFYAPDLDASNSLSSYLVSKNYLDFGAKTLTPASGFWVNKP